MGDPRVGRGGPGWARARLGRGGVGRGGVRYYFKEKLDHYQMPQVCGGPAGRSGRGGGGAGWAAVG